MTQLVKPRGEFQELCFEGRDEIGRANPFLVFAAEENLFHSKLGTIASAEDEPVYKYFAGYRLTKETRTEGVYSFGTSPEFMAFKTTQKRMDEEAAKFAMSLMMRTEGLFEPSLSETHEQSVTADPLPPVPEIPFTDDPRILPAGSLLLCRSGKDGDMWFSLTPEEERDECLLRVAGKVAHTGEEMDCFAGDLYSVSNDFGPGLPKVIEKFPQDNKNAHYNDIYLRRILTGAASKPDNSPTFK